MAGIQRLYNCYRSIIWKVYGITVYAPKMSFPRLGYPAIMKAWEWSAVTTSNVSSSFVISLATWTALSNITVSNKATWACVAWWPWSIRPPKKKNLGCYDVSKCMANWCSHLSILNNYNITFEIKIWLGRNFTMIHLLPTKRIHCRSCWGFLLPFASFPPGRVPRKDPDHVDIRTPCETIRTNLKHVLRLW